MRELQQLALAPVDLADRWFKYWLGWMLVIVIPVFYHMCIIGNLLLARHLQLSVAGFVEQLASDKRQQGCFYVGQLVFHHVEQELVKHEAKLRARLDSQG